MDTIQGKHFSITDPKGVNTVIYRIIETDKSLLNEFPKYTVERLQSSEELRGDLKRKTFFVDEPAEEEDLVIISFGQDRVVVNMGILEENKVKISKKPMPIKFDTLYSENEREYRNFTREEKIKAVKMVLVDKKSQMEVERIVLGKKKCTGTINRWIREYIQEGEENCFKKKKGLKKVEITENNVRYEILKKFNAFLEKEIRTNSNLSKNSKNNIQ